MPTTGTVLAVLYIRYHVLDDRSAYVRRAYNRQVYNPPIYSPGGPKTGGMQGGEWRAKRASAGPQAIANAREMARLSCKHCARC
jgi:hypothetical protein